VYRGPFDRFAYGEPLAACDSSYGTDGSSEVFRLLPAERLESDTTIQHFSLLDPGAVIGTVNAGGPSTFGDVVGAAVLPGERIAIADAFASEIRVFNVDAEHLATFGGKGDGPGEYKSIQGLIELPGDSLGVVDVGRFTVMDASSGAMALRVGLFSQQVHSLTGGISAHGSTQPIAYVGGGEMIGSVQVLPIFNRQDWRPGQFSIDTFAFQLVVTDLSLERRPLAIGEYVAEIGYWYKFTGMSDGSSMGGRHPFTAGNAFAGGPSYFVQTTGMNYGILVRSLNGDTSRVLGYCAGLQPLPDSLIVQEIRHKGRELEALVDMRSAGEEQIAAISHPSHVPGFARVLIDPDERIWAGEFPLRNSPTTWHIFDLEGDLLARAIVKAGVELTSVGDGIAVGVFSDEYDVERVAVFRIPPIEPMIMR